MSWNPPADLDYQSKQKVLRDYFHCYPRAVVIETGLYNGNGSCYQFVGEASVYAFDLRPEWCEAAREAGVAGAYWGDSGATLPIILRGVHEPAFFWLDAHCVVEAEEENSSPLMAELDAILAWPHAAQSVVLIDDLRMMARTGWPTVEQVREKVGETWDREEAQDIMRLTPRG